MKKLLSSAIFLLLTLNIWGQTSFSPALQAKILNSVFEIVIDKIEDDTISYEKPLPFDRLPFKERTDKFNSIGTAFLLDDGTFYSASHVFNLTGKSSFKNYYIRNSQGQTFKVQQITALSNTRDFIRFTVPDFKPAENAGLSPEETFEINSTVYSVGNAQGEGIVIRDGLITSATPEDRNGAWNWIRFSAAASPGNSGGPLINSEGKVIGIITMKNQNENLNYALPITEIKTGNNNIGIIDTREYYSLPNILNYKQYFEFKYEIQLPKSYEELNSELSKAYAEKIQEVVKLMRKEYNPLEKKGFATSSQYPTFNFYSYIPDMPMTVYLNESGVWDYGYGKSYTYKMENNGSIEYSAVMNFYVMNITKPDNVTLKELIENPKIYMDYIVKMLNLYRSVANENITITSLGNPEKSDTYKDYFGRTWYANYYAIDCYDSMVLTYALPLPTGLYVIYKFSTRNQIENCFPLDIGFVADHTYTDYFGHLDQWQEYLSLPEEIMAARSDYEKQFKLEWSENKLSFSNGDCTVNLTPDQFVFDKDTRIDIRNSYNIKDGNLVIENRGISVYNSSKSENYKMLSIIKYPEPLPNADKNTTDVWKQKVSKIAPLNGVPYNYEQYTFLDKIIIPDEKENPDALYEVTFELLNQNQFEQIEGFSKYVIDGLQFN